MADFPTQKPSTENCDQGADSPRAFRADVLKAIQLLTQIIESYQVENGIAGLDGNKKVRVSNLPVGTGADNVAAGNHAHSDHLKSNVAATISATWKWSGNQIYQGNTAFGGDFTPEYPIHCSGTTATRNLTVNPAGTNGALVQVKAGPSYRAGFDLMTGEELRWRLMKSLHEETGTNTGSHFLLQRFDDDGNLLDDAVRIDRDTGTTTVYGELITKQLRVNQTAMPATTTSAGSVGQIAFNSTKFAWCYATNQWAFVTKD